MKHKKVLAIFLSLVIVVCGFAFGLINAYAQTVKIEESMLGVELDNTPSGYDDKIWYVYTPTQSGIYTFYSMRNSVNTSTPNVLRTEAYLFEKVTDEESGQKLYTQLAYSNSNPDYEQYEGVMNSRHFCIKYHLEAGHTYYYAAGFYNEERSSTLYVKLINESYDEAKLVSITPHCDAELTWYTDGEWKTDGDGNAYYLYNISKIMQNMSLTLVFDDGTTITSNAGDTTVEGYPIKYTHDQTNNHWYNSENEKYTANTLTITVLDKSADYEVVINQNAMLSVSGKVVDDNTGSAVSSAQIYIGNTVVATTKSDGTFSFSYSPGSYSVTIKGADIVARTFTLNVDAINPRNNDHTSTPVEVVCGDYVDDDIINGRDYAYIQKTLPQSERTAAKTAFGKYVGFTKNDYEKLIL